MRKYLILFISIPIFGFSQYGSIEFSTGGFLSYQHLQIQTQILISMLVLEIGNLFLPI